MTGRMRAFALSALLVTIGGERAMAIQAPPLESFAEQAPPPAPDYARPANWAARPGHEGAAAAVPLGATPAAARAQVDVFYVSPTTYRSTARWNQDVADTETNGWTDASVIARQASAFNGCCRLFAPRYRQASSRAFTAANGDGPKAYALAYEDVARAFAYYLEHDNHGRPFILAGHSQGALHVSRLVKEQIEGKPLARQLVAAYVIGINLAESAFGTDYRTTAICATPAQTGCIVQWNSVLKGSKLAATADAPPPSPDKLTLCINPLTFDRARPVADAAASLGAVPGDPGYGAMRPLRAKAVGAECRNGLLVVDPAPDLDLKPLPGGIMHYHDVGLFYADVRANAILRANAFLTGLRRSASK